MNMSGKAEDLLIAALPKRVLLTGIAGSIGVHVMQYFLEKTNWEIVGIDSFRHKGYGKRLDWVFAEHPEWKERVRVIQHDLVCPISPAMNVEIGRVDYILHLAALSDVFFSVENPAYVIHNNVMSTLMMLEWAKTVEHEAFVYFSTDEVYGPVEKGDAHPEWAPLRPSNAYSASKAASQVICRPYWRNGEVKLIQTNTMNNHGEMQSPSKFPMMVQRAVNAGETVKIHGTPDNIGSRFYIHSRAVADALMFILAAGVKEHEIGEIDDHHIYHIVGSYNYDNLQLAQTIADIMDKPLTHVFEDFHKDNPAHDIHYGLLDNNLRPLGWKEPVDDVVALKREIAFNEKYSKDWL